MNELHVEQAVFHSLMRQADEKVLLVSPPYGCKQAREAFLSGYETALRDIARGSLIPVGGDDAD